MFLLTLAYLVTTLGHEVQISYELILNGVLGSMDDIRPKGTVELECSKCQWCHWFDPLSQVVIEASRTGVYVCDECLGKPQTFTKADDQTNGSGSSGTSSLS